MTASIVINYCSNERVFLEPLLNQCSIFSNDIVVSYGSKLYDGSNEDEEHLIPYKQKFPWIQFVKYDVDLTSTDKKGVKDRPTAYWHNLARWTGIQALKNKEWVFIIDADEIPDGHLVRIWLDKMEHKLSDDTCYKIATFWYFKDATNQSNTLEDSILLIHHKYLTEDNIFGDYERDHLIKASGCILKRQVRGLHGAILWNHYSWCRSKAGLIHKVRNWAHSNDLFKNVDAEQLVNYIFRNDEVNDIVHGYTYTKVHNRFSIKF